MRKILFGILCMVLCANSYALPAGYTQLEYLQTDGGAYIDTGIKLKASSKLEFKFISGTSYNYAVFGADNGAAYNNGEIALFYYINYPDLGDVIHAVMPSSNSSSYVLEPVPRIVDINATYIISYDKDYLVVNGASQSSGWYANYVGNRNVFLFATNRGDNTWTGGDTKIHYFKMYDGNSLVRDFIPVRRNSDGVLGMYDTVANTLFTNVGTGAFIAGPEIGAASTSYVQGAHEALNSAKMANAVAGTIEWTQGSTSNGIITSVVGAGDKFQVSRTDVTIPVGSPSSPTGRMGMWLE